tara:strand:+ start:8316 stop:9668 length:1353 start_codon:yes stop_codon:yes gene_type:complete
MGNYQAYAEYQESGEEWLGKVPEHWDVIQIKHLSVVKRGASPRPIDDAKYFDEDGEYAWTRIADVTASDVYLTRAPQRLSDLGSSLSVKLEPESLFLSIAGTVGKPCITGMKACIHDGFVYFPELKIPSKFLFYVFAGEQVYKGLGKFGTQLNLNTDTVGGIKIGCTSNDELKGIINFLDHETAKIDTLIDKQQQLITLLKEKRQAVISHAVTKGLNPNAPMHDSGVEWLEEVPAHWTVRRLKHTSKLQSGIPKGKDLTGKFSISVPLLRVANVQDGYLNLDDVHKMAIEPDQLERFSLKKGDVLMNEGGDNDKLGRGAVWQCEIEPCIHQNHVFAIRPYSIEPEWLDLVTRTSYAKFHFFRVAKQSTNLASISSTNIKETPLVIPPLKERMEIMEYVMRKVGAFDYAEVKCSAQISLLQERRTALISAAVTGKIDVRSWQEPTVYAEVE